jgi:carboxy-cis,cis-muconate cyclase
MYLLLATLLSFSLAAANAAQHHLFVGSYGSHSIYGVTYDDAARTLTYVKNNTTRVENEWLALSYDGKTLYSSGLAGWSSFPVTSPTTIGVESSTTPAVGQCSIWQGVFILASRRPPYSVYGSLSCANFIPVGPNGQLNGQAGQVPYNEAAVIYGMAMDPSNSHLYSSDWRTGKLWTHKVNSDGSLTVVSSVDGPSAVSAPRTIVVHPSGRALYVVLEGWNAVALYTINPATRLPVYTGGLFPLLPSSRLFLFFFFGFPPPVLSWRVSPCLL